MNNKILPIAVVVMIIVAAILGFKVINSGNTATNTTAVENSQISLTTQPDPLKMGQANFIIDVKDDSGKPLDNATVFFDLNMTTMNMGTQQGNATAQGNGRYAAAGNLTMMGPWRVRVKVTTPEGKEVNKDFTVNVK